LSRIEEKYAASSTSSSGAKYVVCFVKTREVWEALTLEKPQSPLEGIPNTLAIRGITNVFRSSSKFKRKLRVETLFS